MSLVAVQQILGGIFLLCAVLSWVLIGQVAQALARVNGPPDLVESLSALAFSGGGGSTSIWPGHTFIVKRQFLRFANAELTKAGNRAVFLLYVTYADAALLVGTMALEAGGFKGTF